MPTVFSFCYLHYTRFREVFAPFGYVIYVKCKDPILLPKFVIIIIII